MGSTRQAHPTSRRDLSWAEPAGSWAGGLSRPWLASSSAFGGFAEEGGAAPGIGLHLSPVDWAVQVQGMELQ